jgi:DNA-binding CsgD family transcriptional regulator
VSYRNSDFQLETLLKLIPGVVYQFVVTPKGQWYFAYISDTVEDLYEVPAESVLSDHNVLTLKIHPDDRQSHRKSVEEAVRTCSSWAHLHRIVTASGREKWVLAQASPELSKDGSVVWSGVLTDLTGFLKGSKNLFFQLLSQYRDSLSEHRFLLERDTEKLDSIQKSYITKVGSSRVAIASPIFCTESVAPDVAVKNNVKSNLDDPNSGPMLSARECEVLELMAHGLQSKAIATRLGVSVTTISAHRRNMKKKLCFRSGTDLMRYAVLVHSTGK